MPAMALSEPKRVKRGAEGMRSVTVKDKTRKYDRLLMFGYSIASSTLCSASVHRK